MIERRTVGVQRGLKMKDLRDTKDLTIHRETLLLRNRPWTHASVHGQDRKTRVVSGLVSLTRTRLRSAPAPRNTPFKIYSLQDHRWRSPSGVVVQLGSRFLSQTTSSQGHAVKKCVGSRIRQENTRRLGEREIYLLTTYWSETT